MKHVYLLLAFIAMLVALGVIFPTNTLTGHVVNDDLCGDLGCVRLCEMDAAPVDDGCGAGEVCCSTHWSSGVCDYDINCERIREYSLYQTIETYQDTLRESPAPVTPDVQRFFLPIAVIICIIAVIVYKYRSPTHG